MRVSGVSLKAGGVAIARSGVSEWVLGYEGISVSLCGYLEGVSFKGILLFRVSLLPWPWGIWVCLAAAWGVSSNSRARGISWVSLVLAFQAAIKALALLALTWF